MYGPALERDGSLEAVNSFLMTSGDSPEKPEHVVPHGELGVESDRSFRLFNATSEARLR